MSLYEYAAEDEMVYDILTDRTLNHQQALEDLREYFRDESFSSRTSVRRARDKLGVRSPESPLYLVPDPDPRATFVSVTEKSRELNSRLAQPPRTPVFEAYTIPSTESVSPEPDPVHYGPWEKGKPATAVFLGDWQTGCENQRLIDSAIEFIKDLQPDVIGHTGDETDNTVLGRWVKGTGDEYTGTLQDQIDRAEQNLRAISEVAPYAHRHLADSNHNQRLEKSVAERLPGLESLRCLKMEKLLRLSENGWEFHRQQYEILPDLLLFHGHAEGFASGTPLKRIEDFLLRKGKSFVFGHTHRFGLHTTAQGYEFDMRTLFAANPGHMMELHHADYVRHRSPNWSSGLILVHYDGENLYPETVLANNDRLYYQGKRY